MINSESLIVRQGGIIAVASVLSGLKNCGQFLDRSFYAEVAQIPGIVYPLCEKRTLSLGSALMRRAVNIFMELLSAVIPKEIIKVIMFEKNDDFTKGFLYSVAFRFSAVFQCSDWFRCLELNFCDENEDIRKGSCKAGGAFFELFVSQTDAEFLAQRIRHIYLPQVFLCWVEGYIFCAYRIDEKEISIAFYEEIVQEHGKFEPLLCLQVVSAKAECDREGKASLLGVMPKHILLLPTPSGCVAADVVHTLTAVISRQVLFQHILYSTQLMCGI